MSDPKKFSGKAIYTLLSYHNVGQIAGANELYPIQFQQIVGTIRT